MFSHSLDPKQAFELKKDRDWNLLVTWPAEPEQRGAGEAGKENQASGTAQTRFYR